MTRLLTSTACLAAAAAIVWTASTTTVWPAQENEREQIWPNPSGSTDPDQTAWVRIVPPQVDDAVATIVFQNRISRSPDEDVFALKAGKIVVTVTYVGRYSMEPDTISVDAPIGYVAVPRSVTVEEGAQGLIHIYEYLGG